MECNLFREQRLGQKLESLIVIATVLAQEVKIGQVCWILLPSFKRRGNSNSLVTLMFLWHTVLGLPVFELLFFSVARKQLAIRKIILSTGYAHLLVRKEN